jgi:hypothetical protein
VALKDGIQCGEYRGEIALNKERRDGFIKFHRINNIIILNGERYDVSVLIGEDRDGRKFYNMNRKKD